MPNRNISPQEELILVRNKALCKIYPFLKWYGDPLCKGYSEDNGPDYHYTWEDMVPEGWKKAFCPQMWDELLAILQEADYVNDFRFIQIKEKFGTLRLYSGGTPTKIADEILKWELKYKHLSEEICIDCGAPATYMATGWINFICKDCAKQRAKDQCDRYGTHDHFVKIENIEEFYRDREAYWEKHKKDDVLKD